MTVLSLLVCFFHHVYDKLQFMNSMCTINCEMYSIFEHFTFSNTSVQCVSMNRCWLGGVFVLQTSEHVCYFSFLQIHVGVLVRFFTRSRFPAFL